MKRTYKVAIINLFLGIFFANTAFAFDPYLVKDINSGMVNSSPSNGFHSSELNGFMYFAATDSNGVRGLWKTDGTDDGTTLVTNINNGDLFSVSGVINSRVILLVATSSEGFELWSSDGTASGTSLLKDINPGPNSSFIDIGSFVKIANVFIFSANDGVHGPELWRTDGTSEGTFLLKDIDPFQGNFFAPFIEQKSVVGDNLFFSADDGVFGSELWKTDGTTSGTTMVKNISVGGSSSFSEIVNLNDRALFAVYNGGNDKREFWTSDGTEVGTNKFLDLAPFSQIIKVTSVGNQALFSYDLQDEGNELWKTDGTAVGTQLVSDINPGSDDGVSLANFSSVNDKLLFFGDEGINGIKAWSSDGTVDGTKMLTNATPFGTIFSDFDPFTIINNKAYFVANDGASGDELYETDGTAANTFILTDISIGSGSSSPKPLGFVNNRLILSATSPDFGRELWALVIDSCPTDNNKLGPEICGCGLADIDANVNGVIDCLANQDLTLQLELAAPLLQKLKLKRDGTASKKVRRNGRLLKKMILSAVLYAQVNATKFTGLLDGASVVRNTFQLSRVINQVVIFDELNFKAKKRRALRMLKQLVVDLNQ